MRIIFFLLLVFCVSCNLSINPQGDKPEYYFDVQNFIETQVSYLEESKPTIEKMVSINQKVEKKNLQNVEWKKELDLFIQADINKSAFKGLYEKKDSTTTDGKLIVTYNAQSSSLHTQCLKVVFEKETNAVVSIQAEMQADNYLYSTYKNILLVCKRNAKGRMTITEYDFRGKQKMIFSKPEVFQINGKLL